ncbi:MAG: hypothetical protein AAGG75_15275 [Bacteroidota bacterium]
MKYFDLIESYLKGELSTAERQAFEQALAEDAALREELEYQRFAQESMELLLADDTRAYVGSLLEDDDDPLKKKNDDRSGPTLGAYRWLILLLAVLIGAGVYYYTWYQSKNERELPMATVVTPVTSPPTSPAVEDTMTDVTVSTGEATNSKIPLPTDQDGQKAPEAPLPRPSDQEEDPPLAAAADELLDLSSEQKKQIRGALVNVQQIAMKSSENDPAGDKRTTVEQLLDAFQNEEDEVVIRLADSLMTTDPQYAKSQEILGLALFRLKRYEEAADVFRIVANLNVSPYDERSDWNLLLALLLQDNPSKSQWQEASRTIENDPEHFYYTKLRDLKATNVELQ